MSNVAVIYHGPGCWDGLASAWVVSKVLATIEVIPCQYSDPVPDVKDKDTVYILDFSFPLDVMRQLAKQNACVICLDHHKTAARNFAGILDDKGHGMEGNLVLRFDMDKSGAMLTWKYFHPIQAPHWLINYTQDLDLWSWKLPNSRAINACIHSLPQTFATLDELATYPDVPSIMISEGNAILRYQKQMVDNICKNAWEKEIAGHKVLVANTSVLISETGEQLAKGRPFSATFFQKDGKRIWSLRSAEGGADVSVIAKSLGGGGHVRAAGYAEEGTAP